MKAVTGRVLTALFKTRPVPTAEELSELELDKALQRCALLEKLQQLLSAGWVVVPCGTMCRSRCGKKWSDEKLHIPGTPDSEGVYCRQYGGETYCFQHFLIVGNPVTREINELVSGRAAIKTFSRSSPDEPWADLTNGWSHWKMAPLLH